MKKIINKVGFFNNLNRPKKDKISDKPSPYKEELINYLKSGYELILVPGIAYDLLSKNDYIIGSITIFTDGIYAWTSDVEYYVREYNLILEQNFINHIKLNKWKVPKIENLSEYYID